MEIAEQKSLFISISHWQKITLKKVYLGFFSYKKMKKNWHYNHQQSFWYENYKNSTTLSTYLWSIKSGEQNFNLSWEIMRQAAPYSNISKRCLLCLHERSVIQWNLSGWRMSRIVLYESNYFVSTNYFVKTWKYFQLILQLLQTVTNVN